jgi:hypothetical protein
VIFVSTLVSFILVVDTRNLRTIVLFE